jgi:hypothetical protein
MLVVPIGALFLLAPCALAAQAPGDTLAQQFEVDFAIPDAPAFELLQVDASNILRPTTVRALTAGLSNLFEEEGGGLQIPNAFAIEAAPFLLAQGPRLTLDAYRENRILYRTRLSAGAKRSGSTGALTGVALGLRMTLSDAADLRTDTVFLKGVTALTDSMNALRVRAIIAGGPNAQLTKAQQDSLTAMSGTIANFVKIWEQTRWNEDVFDVAAGLMAASADSLGNDLKMGALAAWGTWGVALQDWGQMLVGGRASYGRDDPDEERGLTGSLGTRFYAGTNVYKFFMEGQSTLASDASPGWLLHTGGEARLIDRFWMNFSAGVNWEGSGNAHLTGRFTVKAAAPPIF